MAPFEKPKVELEQYPTGPHLASRLLFAVASSYGEFEGRTCIDLGCGTVRLLGALPRTCARAWACPPGAAAEASRWLLPAASGKHSTAPALTPPAALPCGRRC